MFGVDDMAIAGLAAGALSSAGQIYANNKNIQFAQGNNESQIHLANTAHQREVRDLLAAGLNPVLSASGSGSPVPQLGSPDIGNPGQGLSDGINSAAKVLSDEYKANVANLRANTKATELANTARSLDLEVERVNSEADLELAKLRRSAAFSLGGWNEYNYHGSRMGFLDRKKRDSYIKLLSDAMETETRNKTNANWRANLSSFLEILGAISGFMPKSATIQHK